MIFEMKDIKNVKPACGNGKTVTANCLYLWSDASTRSAKKRELKFDVLVPLKTFQFNNNPFDEVGAFAEYIDNDSSTARLFYPTFCHQNYKTVCNSVTKKKKKWKSGLAMDERLKGGEDDKSDRLHENLITSYLLFKTIEYLNNNCNLLVFNGDENMMFELVIYCYQGKFTTNINGEEIKALSVDALRVTSEQDGAGRQIMVLDQVFIDYFDQVGYFSVLRSNDGGEPFGIGPSATLPSFNEQITHCELWSQIRDVENNSSAMGLLIQEFSNGRKSEFEFVSSIDKAEMNIKVSK